MKKPANGQEAQKYIGQTILKLFEDNNEYKGTVQDVDTEVETDEGVVEGLFFRIEYDDGDEEHLTWDELSMWLANAQKQHKGKGAAKQKAAGSGAADVAAVNDRTSNKRQRRSAASHQQPDATPDAAAEDDEQQYEQPAAAGPSGRAAGSKRRRAQQQQHPPEVKSEEEQEDSPVPAPVPSPGSLRKNPRKSTKPRMAVVSPPQQQQQAQHKPKRRRSQAAAAAAAGSASEQEQEDEEEEDAVEESGGSEEYTPQQGGRKKQQQQPSKKQRAGQQQQQRQQQRQRQEAEEDAAMEDAEAAAAADEGPEEEEDEQEQQEDEELAREVAREHAAWEAEQARPKHFVVRRQGTAGHIKHVQVINFMCHHNFAMDFGTHVNVISGRNGSGKSAVLQAMQAALGSKAKDTGRGDNFRELVRTGCHEARVKVTLWNTGGDAYQHAVYGDWITIERVIKTAGGTQYKILNSTSKKVAEGFKNVAALLDHLNVDASNPLAVLTQDTARNFLCGTVADKKKYEIFMKATCLQTMYDYLIKASGYVEEMKVAFKGVRDEHEARKAEVDELRSKLQKLQESSSLVEQCALFERAALWAQVKKQQEALDTLKTRLEVKAPQVKAKNEAALAEANAALEEIRRKEEQEVAARMAEQEEARNFTDAMSALAAELKRAKAATRTKQQAARRLEGHLQQLQAEMKNIMEAKRETNDDRQREYEQRLQQHQVQMGQARAALAAAEAKVGKCHQAKEGMRADIQAKEAEVRQLQIRLQSDQATVANLQQHLQQLQQAKGQKLAMFGPHAILRQMVDQNIRRFNKPPIGPVGAHLTLRDTKWAIAGEVVLGGSLELWIVDSARDLQVLRTMARQVQGMRDLKTLVSRFDRQAYRIPDSKRLRPGWRNLREFVRIDHPDPQAKIIIDNKLMDQTRFEVVVVHEEEEKCRDAMYNMAAGPSVVMAVHPSGLNVSKKRNNTLITSRYFTRNGAVPRIGASFEDDFAQTQQLLQDAQAHVREVQQKLTAANGELQQLQAQSNSFTYQEKQALGVKSRAAHKVAQLQTQAPVLEADDDSGEDLVADSLRQLQESINEVQLKYGRAEQELNEAKLNEDKAKKLHEDRQVEMQQTLTQMNDRTEALDRLTAQKDAATNAKADAEAKLAALADQVAKLEAGVAQTKQVLDAFKEAGLKGCTEEQGWAALQQASDNIKAELATKLRKKLTEQVRRGQRTDLDTNAALEEAVQTGVRDTYEQIVGREDGGAGLFQKQADKLEKQVAEAEKEAGGNQEELELTLRRAEAEYNRNHPSVSNMHTVVRMCVKAVDERWRKYDELFESVSRTVSAKFMGYMHRRGHQGQVVVNSDAGELKLLVKINAKAHGAEGKRSKAVKDLKQLSGGERSFTTVAFILALGKFTESPFRAMDEYDVFMDAVNRRIATQTLLEFALEEGGLQFVLLTPQDLQAVEDAKKHLASSKGHDIPEGFVKVVQMRPAREGGQQHH